MESVFVQGHVYIDSSGYSGKGNIGCVLLPYHIMLVAV